MSELDQFKETYIAECYELLEEMEQKLLELDEQNADPEDLNAIFRCAHSIKGGAGAFGFDNITNFTHILEYLLDSMRDGTLAPTRESIDTLLRSVDIVTQMVQAAEEGTTLPADFGADIAQELQSYSADPTAPAPENTDTETPQPSDQKTNGSTTYHIQFTPHENLLSTGNEPLLLIKELEELGSIEVQVDLDKLPGLELIDPELCYLSWRITLTSECGENDIMEVFEFVEDECDLTITADTEASQETQEEAEPLATPDTVITAPTASQPATADAPAAQAKSTPANRTIRVEIDKVDRMVNMVGELVITQAMLYAQTQRVPVDQYPELLKGVEELSQHTRELQEAIMSVRMQPVKSIFSRMPRIVRDLSGQLGKDIQIVMTGEDTEVDKTVIEQLGDPLTHMLRNSIDHGIETPQIRQEKGKPKAGTIRLSADNRGGRIILEIADDGAGINRERVLSIAQSKGLVAADATLADEEIDNLIFLPGFSTAEEVTNISGRGVGMDVVRRNIEELGGSVQIRSTPGEGSVFTVSLPLTLAILDGMIIRVGNEHYIIPIANIIETLRPEAEEIRTIADGNDLINVRGEFVPLHYLYHSFGVTNAIEQASKGLVVLVESGRDKVGLVVDDLIGQQQVVIKTLEENADPVPGISGATILGDGHVALILDIGGLYAMTQKELGKHHQLNSSNAA